MLVLTLCSCIFWEAQNDILIDGEKASDLEFSIDLNNSRRFVLGVFFQCKGGLDITKLNTFVDADICTSEATAKLALSSTLLERCIPNTPTSDCTFLILSIPGTSKQERLLGLTEFELKAGSEIPPGTHSVSLVITTGFAVPTNSSPFPFPTPLGAKFENEEFKIIVPHGTFITPETITQVGAFKLQFEPHPQANFTKVEFYEDTNLNSDDDDQLLASPTSPPFEVNVDFTENGTRAFYVKAFETTLSEPIMSNKQDVVVDIQSN